MVDEEEQDMRYQVSLEGGNGETLEGVGSDWEEIATRLYNTVHSARGWRILALDNRSSDAHPIGNHRVQFGHVLRHGLGIALDPAVTVSVEEAGDDEPEMPLPPLPVTEVVVGVVPGELMDYLGDEETAEGG